jgi:hypothetical protein
MPGTVKAAIALADAAVARENLKLTLIEHRERGDTCTHKCEELKDSYKAAKHRYRSCLAIYIKKVSAFGNSVI